MPTFVAPNMEYNAELDDHYAPYNKPSAIAAWLRVCGCLLHGDLHGFLLVSVQALLVKMSMEGYAAHDMCGANDMGYMGCAVRSCQAEGPLATGDTLTGGRAGVSQEAEPEEEFIMVIDADSILRMPLIPEQLGVERGAPHHSPLSC